MNSEDNKDNNHDNVTNSKISDNDGAPADPSSTSDIGQRVGQGVIDIKDGISEQSNKWEDNLQEYQKSNK